MSQLPHIPEGLPVKNFTYDRLVPIVGEARAALAEYNGLLKGMVSPEVLLSPLTTQEAVLSSTIEGTQATFGEVLQYEAGTKYDTEKTTDIRLILNYREAVYLAQQRMDQSGLTLGLIKELHSLLLTGVRGQDANPGRFRTDLVWIGKKGCTIGEARYIPPEPTTILEHMENFVSYISSKDIDPLIQTGLAHAQFEIIHPFGDGNGRLGRILIPLLLYKKGLLTRPSFYLSGYLEAHREKYHSSLHSITEMNDWQGWVEFFLTAVINQANKNNRRADEIISLYNTMKERFEEASRSQYTRRALEAFFKKPFINSKDFYEEIRSENRNQANKILKTLEENQLIALFRKGKGSVPSIYVMPELVNITEGKQIFSYDKEGNLVAS